MFRALLRLVSMVMLAIAVIMAVLDATRSIAAEAIVLTPLSTSWRAVSPSTLDGLHTMIADNLPAFFSDPVAAGLLALPGFAVFAGLSLLAALAGRRKPARLSGRLASQR